MHRTPYQRLSRALSRPSERARLAWLGGAAGLITVLFVALVWIAHDNATRPHLLPVASAQVRVTRPVQQAAAEPPAPASVPPLVLVRPETKAAPPPKAPPAPRAIRPARAVAPPRRSRPPPPTRPAPEESDSDVALISAIVGYSSRHAPNSAHACPLGKTCRAGEP